MSTTRGLRQRQRIREARKREEIAQSMQRAAEGEHGHGGCDCWEEMLRDSEREPWWRRWLG